MIVRAAKKITKPNKGNAASSEQATKDGTSASATKAKSNKAVPKQMPKWVTDAMAKTLREAVQLAATTGLKINGVRTCRYYKEDTELKVGDPPLSFSL